MGNVVGSDNLQHNISSFYDLEAKLIDGRPYNFSALKGKPVLIVNTASECGLTKTNFEQLLEVNKRYHSRGLEILVFPCNQFMGQEPGTDAEIRQRMQERYGIPREGIEVFERVSVNGDETHNVFKYLRSQPSVSSSRIKWNFGKFLVDGSGNVINRFGPTTAPMSIASHLEAVVQPEQK